MSSPNQSKLRSSVIIPSFNESYYLERCLDALVNQTRKIDEIIVVDNNSSDDSVMRAKAKFKDVIFLFQPKIGTPFARNMGFDSANGDVLIRIDADSIVDPDWHELIMSDFESRQIDAWSGYVYSNEVNRIFKSITPLTFNFLTFRLIKFISGCRMLLGCNCAIKANLWKTVRNDLNMRNDIWEDLDLSLAVDKTGAEVFISTEQKLSISTRASNDSPIRIFNRLHGQTRVYSLRKMRFAFIKSLLLSNISFLAWMLQRPFALIGMRRSTRSRPEQY